MNHKYDLFEKFSDGSSLWRDVVLGLETTHLRMKQLAQKSGNHIYAINITTGEIFAFSAENGPQGIHLPVKPGKRSKSQAA